MTVDGGYALTIDGKGVLGAAAFDVVSPATEQVIGQAPDCSRGQLDEAVAAARRAFPGWAATPIYAFLTGGDVPGAPGYFIPITILHNPPESSRIVHEEQFGPVLPLLKFDDIDEVVARGNATDYGLGGSVWSADTDKALSVARRLQSGTVWVNETQHLTPLSSFGGHKHSGLGVEGGAEGLAEYTNAQTIVVRKAA